MAAVPTPRDGLITYGSGYALVTVFLIWLDIGGIPDNYFDTTAQWISSLSLFLSHVSFCLENVSMLSAKLY